MLYQNNRSLLEPIISPLVLGNLRANSIRAGHMPVMIGLAGFLLQLSIFAITFVTRHITTTIIRTLASTFLNQHLHSSCSHNQHSRKKNLREKIKYSDMNQIFRRWKIPHIYGQFFFIIKKMLFTHWFRASIIRTILNIAEIHELDLRPVPGQGAGQGTHFHIV